MIQKKKNNERFNTRQFFTVVFTLFLLLSSCSTKRGIKTLLDIPISTAETAKHKNNYKLAKQSNNCLSCEDLQVVTVEFSDISSLVKNLSSATIQEAVYTGFLYNIFIDAPTGQTYSPPSILREVPIYILFKKLILHNA